MDHSGVYSNYIFGDHTYDLAQHFGCEPAELPEKIFQSNVPVKKKSTDLPNANTVGSVEPAGDLLRISLDGNKGEWIGNLKIYYNINADAVAPVHGNGLTYKHKFRPLSARIYINGALHPIGFADTLDEQLADEHAEYICGALANSRSPTEVNMNYENGQDPRTMAQVLPPNLRRTDYHVDPYLRNNIIAKPYFEGNPNGMGAVYNEINPADPVAGANDAETIVNVLAVNNKNGRFKLPNMQLVFRRPRRVVPIWACMKNDFLNTAQLIPNYVGTRVEMVQGRKRPLAISNAGGAVSNLLSNHSECKQNGILPFSFFFQECSRCFNTCCSWPRGSKP